MVETGSSAAVPPAPPALALARILRLGPSLTRRQNSPLIASYISAAPFLNPTTTTNPVSATAVMGAAAGSGAPCASRHPRRSCGSMRASGCKTKLAARTFTISTRPERRTTAISSGSPPTMLRSRATMAWSPHSSAARLICCPGASANTLDDSPWNGNTSSLFWL